MRFEDLVSVLLIWICAVAGLRLVGALYHSVLGDTDLQRMDNKICPARTNEGDTQKCFSPTMSGLALGLRSVTETEGDILVFVCCVGRLGCSFKNPSTLSCAA